MTVLHVNRFWTGDLEERVDEQGFAYRKVERYQVITDSVMRQEDILADAKIPARFSLHPEVNILRAVSRRITGRDETRTVVNLTVTYSNRHGKDEKESDNPLDRPARISKRAVNRTVPFVRDVEDRPVITAAGEPIEGLETQVADWIFDVRKNVAIEPKWLPEFQNTINKNPVTIRNWKFEPYTLLFGEYQATDRHMENEVPFQAIGFSLAFRRGGWFKRPFHAGFHQLVTEEVNETDEQGNTQTIEKTKKKRIRLSDGSYPGQPQFLDREGKWIELDSIIEVTPEGELVPSEQLEKLIVMKFQEFPAKSFGKLKALLH